MTDPADAEALTGEPFHRNTGFDVHPAAQSYYPAEIEFAMQCTRERIEEWEYREDAHGYCHDRPDLVALLGEIDRLRAIAEPAAATLAIGQRAYWVQEYTLGTVLGAPSFSYWYVYTGVVMSTGPAVTQVWNDNSPEPREHHPLTFANDKIWADPATPEQIIRDNAAQQQSAPNATPLDA